MYAYSLVGIVDHDAVARLSPGEDFHNPDLESFHEVVCDLARKAVKNPACYSDLPSEIADSLETINTEVLKVMSAARTYRILR